MHITIFYFFLIRPQQKKAKEHKIMELLLKYGVQVYKINLNDYDDVGEMSPQDFKKRKENASFVEDKFYLLMEKTLGL